MNCLIPVNGNNLKIITSETRSDPIAFTNRQCAILSSLRMQDREYGAIADSNMSTLCN